MQTTITEINDSKDEFIALRHKIHQNPELGFKEKNTSDLIAELLTKWGYEVHRGLAGTGVVGTLKTKSGKKRLGIRADIDALPITETSGKPWASKNPGIAHSCGHDGHTTMLLCAAKYLANTKKFDGTLHLIFQPAEELLCGGEKMVNDGLFDLFPCDSVFGLHNVPGFKAGEFYFCDGPMMASSDTINIEVFGVGAHGAMPENSVDATMTACYIGTALQSIVARNVPPQQAGVITIGCIQSGNAPNVINDHALMKLTVRSLNRDVRTHMLKRIQEVATLQAESFGAKAKIEHIGASPVLVNDPKMTEFAFQVAKDTFGEEKVHRSFPPQMGSEDFAFMLDHVKSGSYLGLGTGDQKGYSALHTPGYDFNDDCIVPGATYWAQLAQAYLKG